MRTLGTYAYHAFAGPALPTPPKPAYPGNGCYQRVSSGRRVNGPNCGPTFHMKEEDGATFGMRILSEENLDGMDRLNKSEMIIGPRQLDPSS